MSRLKCPLCDGIIEPWWWQDGAGAKGLRCCRPECYQKWWSESFARGLAAVQEAAIEKYLQSATFPVDIEREEDYERRTEEFYERRAFEEKWNVCLCKSKYGVPCPTHPKSN